MTQTTKMYFLNSKKVLLSIGLAFFLTNCLELLLIFLFSLLSKTPVNIHIPAYFIQSITITTGLWISFKFFKNAPIYVIALSTGATTTLLLSALTFLSSSTSIMEFMLTHIVSSFILVFIWMHLTQNLENKTKALKIGYFSFFIVVECLSLISSTVAGGNHILFLLLAIIGYKISSVIFELMIKIAFKLLHVDTTA